MIILFVLGIKTKIIEIFRKNVGPKEVKISPIGFECNNSCAMCWRNSVSGEERDKILNSKVISVNEYEKFLNNLPITVDAVEVQGGGEPLLYKDFGKLVEIIKKKYQGGLITNGVFLDKYAKTLVDNNWDYIRISINSACGETYKKVNGSDSFEKVVKNIGKLNDIRVGKKLKIILHFVIQKDNFKDLKKLFDLAKKINVDELSFDYVLAFGKDKNKLMMTEKDWKSAEILIKNILKTKVGLVKNNLEKVLYMRENHPFWSGKKNNNKYLKQHRCDIIKNNIYILSDGTCLPCCLADKKMFDLNILDQPLGLIWKKYRNARKNIYQKKYMGFCKKFCNYKIE